MERLTYPGYIGGSLTPAQVKEREAKGQRFTVCGYCKHCEHAYYLQFAHMCAPNNARTGRPTIIVM